MKARLLITTVVPTACGNKLYELFEAMVMVVKLVLLTREQGSAFPAMMQEVAELKEEEIILLEVMILMLEPALVRKLGVTVKEIELVEDCMLVILLASPEFPVSNEI